MAILKLRMRPSRRGTRNLQKACSERFFPADIIMGKEWAIQDLSSNAVQVRYFHIDLLWGQEWMCYNMNQINSHKRIFSSLLSPTLTLKASWVSRWLLFPSLLFTTNNWMQRGNRTFRGKRISLPCLATIAVCLLQNSPAHSSSLIVKVNIPNHGSQNSPSLEEIFISIAQWPRFFPPHIY